MDAKTILESNQKNKSSSFIHEIEGLLLKNNISFIKTKGKYYYLYFYEKSYFVCLSMIENFLNNYECHQMILKYKHNFSSYPFREDKSLNIIKNFKLFYNIEIEG